MTNKKTPPPDPEEGWHFWMDKHDEELKKWIVEWHLGQRTDNYESLDYMLRTKVVDFVARRLGDSTSRIERFAYAANKRYFGEYMSSSRIAQEFWSKDSQDVLHMLDKVECYLCKMISFYNGVGREIFAKRLEREWQEGKLEKRPPKVLPTLYPDPTRPS